MVYLEGISMVEADTHVVWDQFNTEGLMGPAFCACGRSTIQSCEVEIRGGGPLLMCNLWFISTLRGQPRTPPSGDNLGVLNYNLKH